MITIVVQDAGGFQQTIEASPPSLSPVLHDLMTGDADIIQIDVMVMDGQYLHKSVYEFDSEDALFCSKLVDPYTGWTRTIEPIERL